MPPPRVKTSFTYPGQPLTAQPTGEGERVGSELSAGWTYHFSEGWKMTDNPLGSGYHTKTLGQALQDSGFFGVPSFTVGGEAAKVSAVFFQRSTSVEYLCVLSSPVGRHYLLIRGFPSGSPSHWTSRPAEADSGSERQI
jgi:hypothetical protein